MNFISIIIPTYNDWKRLALCLAGLEAQTYPQEGFEILVVNNNPEDEVPAGFRIPANCRIFIEPKPGSYAARNAALRIARGEIIGFTDSDCIPKPYWIENAVKTFEENPDVTRIAGRIELFYQSNRLTTAELYEKVYAFRQDFAASIGSSVTGNMFVYRHILDAVGNFNETLLSGGDHEWSMRALNAGSKIVFGKDVTICHPARYKMSELTKKARRTGGFHGRNKGKALTRLLKYSIPPVNSFVLGRRLSVADNFTVFMVRYYLNFIKSVEEVRISFGKQPNRE